MNGGDASESNGLWDGVGKGIQLFTSAYIKMDENIPADNDEPNSERENQQVTNPILQPVTGEPPVPAERPGEFQSPNQQPSIYDHAFISSYNALEHSFYMRGREMSSHHWQLRNELEAAYQQGANLPDYEQVSLYHVHKQWIQSICSTKHNRPTL